MHVTQEFPRGFQAVHPGGIRPLKGCGVGLVTLVAVVEAPKNRTFICVLFGNFTRE